MSFPDEKGVDGGYEADPADAKWVERAFSRRDCARFVPSTKDATRCACGQTWVYHKTHGVEGVGQTGEVW